jgi:HEAT repeat protein
METDSSNEKIERLVGELGDKNGYFRENARKALVKIGKPAVPHLIELLSHPEPLLRWEACKTLDGIKDPTAIAPLVTALDDEKMQVRWVAAEALIALKTKAIIPLLHALENEFDSSYMRQGAHHILHALERDDLLNKKTIEVLDALRFLEPRVSVATAARRALNSLEKLD